jgi:tRNA dimethylallyltransferase
LCAFTNEAPGTKSSARVNPRLVAIAGPTGSGKSALALDLSEAFHGEIVNCDSLQLYRGFDIGTAKTPSGARRGIPHHLFDILPASREFSAGEYAKAARAAIDEIAARASLPIVVGGSGFYLRALLEGLPETPARDAELRAKLTQREQRRPGSLHRLLARLEPARARWIHERDAQKLIRALEIRILTRRPVPERSLATPLSGYCIFKLGLDPDRAPLYARLDERVRWMFAGGIVEEVRRLLAEGATGREKPFESLGYKQALAHVRGQATLEEAIASTQLETRRYAKRQWTWFRRDPEVRWLKGFGGEATVRQQAFEALQSFYKTCT